MWDFTLFRMVPGVCIAAPRDEATLRAALQTAVGINDRPTVIRFPKGELPDPTPALESKGEVDILLRSPQLSFEADESKTTILMVGIGAMVPVTLEAANLLQQANANLRIDVVSPNWVWPIPSELEQMTADYDYVVTVEDGLAAGGIGSALEEASAADDIFVKHLNLGVPTQFLAHASREQILTKVALTAESIADKVQSHVMLGSSNKRGVA
jgi:1-deoxy-D-xylulose-5-phosphate synthase